MRTLQDRLDQIARERAVLALLQDLAARGLREGDPVRHVDTGEVGQLNIARDGGEPRTVVVLRSGASAAFDRCWRRDE